jgi:hypothetical protein
MPALHAHVKFISDSEEWQLEVKAPCAWVAVTLWYLGDHIGIGICVPVLGHDHISILVLCDMLICLGNYVSMDMRLWLPRWPLMPVVCMYLRGI